MKIFRHLVLLTQLWSINSLHRFVTPKRQNLNKLHSTSLPSPAKNINGLNNKKYIVITGGVISGIGKGVIASSIGVILKMLDIRPTAIKIDPYLNVDAGTMSPFEHGEVFVLDDGGETDLDLGNYERFMDLKLTNDSNLTTGKVYQAVIAKERRGDYLGKTVQIIPHITNEIIEQIKRVGAAPVDESKEEPDVCVIELGGTIGDIESMPFVEALRQLQLQVSPENFCLVHVSMLPVIGPNGEQKSKPTQHSVKELRSLGLSPDFIVCRAKVNALASVREKISLFCNVPVDNVLSCPDVPDILEVPVVLEKQKFRNLLSKRMKLDQVRTSKDKTERSFLYNEEGDVVNLNKFYNNWETMLENIRNSAQNYAKVALVGKYTDLSDSYLSVISSLEHACINTNQKLKLIMVESTDLEDGSLEIDATKYITAWDDLKSADAVLVPGGFGVRGIEGKISAIRYARENKIPFLGICLGMQAAVIEYTRSVLNRKNANSREFAPEVSDDNAAVIFMPEGSKDQMGGTMRLGVRKTIMLNRPFFSTKNKTKTEKFGESIAGFYYGEEKDIYERHRHRYEVNPKLVSSLEEQGLKFTGTDETGERMEIIELDSEEHPYFVAVQFHPEFKSRPQRPSPVFLGLLEAVLSRKNNLEY